MREILFRGKTDKGEWVQGDLLTYSDICKICVSCNDIDLGELKDCYFVPIETVGQYTGLTDKNGTKMFEGDIVAGAVWWQEQAKNGLVAFKDGSFGLLWYRGEVEQFNAFTSMCNIEYEVIGNIHDNPELLKGGVE